jgi:putative ABC transport system permease protein
LPLDGWSDWSFLVEGDPEPDVRNIAQMRWIAGDYFKALGIRLVAGRTFTDSDTADAPRVGIVNEKLVAKYLHGQNPIGKRFLFHMRPGEKEWHPFTVVGIVGDTRDMGIDEPVHAFFYAPYAQEPQGSTGFVVRAPRLGAAVLPAMRAAVASVDPTQPLSELGPLQNFVDRSLGSRKFILLLLGIFAGLGLALAVLGIYGVTSYSVVQRTQEIAVRMAMGADDVAIVRLVLAHALRLVGIGLFFGAICAAFLGHYLASLIYGLSPWDPQAVSIISALLITAALVAGWVPARRAAALPLANALRAE